MKPSKAIGLLSILAGITACVGVIGMATIFATPVGLISGGIAVRKGQKLLGWIGVGLSILAPVVWTLLLWHWGWFSGDSSGD